MPLALITGHTGFVGRHLSAHLQLNGYKVVGFSVSGGQDIRRYEQIRNTIYYSQPDEIYHLAAQAYVPETTTDPQRGVAINTIGTLNLLEAVRQTGCRARILIAGSSEEYGYELGDRSRWFDEFTDPRPTTPYGVSKLAAGLLGMAYGTLYGIHVVATRAWNHTGPGQQPIYAIPSWARQIAQIEAHRGAGVLRHGNLDARRSYLDVGDVVMAYGLAIGCEPGVYNIGHGRSWTMGEILQMLVSHAQVQVRMELDPKLYRPGLQLGGGEFPITEARRLHEATGWQAVVPIENTLRSVLDDWRGRL